MQLQQYYNQYLEPATTAIKSIITKHPSDVLHGLLTNSALSGPDDFLSKRDGLISQLSTRLKLKQDCMSMIPFFQFLDACLELHKKLDAFNPSEPVHANQTVGNETLIKSIKDQLNGFMEKAKSILHEAVAKVGEAWTSKPGMYERMYSRSSEHYGDERKARLLEYLAKPV